MGALPAQLDPFKYPAGATYAPPQSNAIDALQFAVIERLKSKITGLEITDFPDAPEDWELTAQTGAILVGYHGTAYELPPTTDLTVHQDCRIEFECSVVIRDLGWAKGRGVYAVLQAIRGALMGFRAPGSKHACYVLREEFVSRKDGVWIFAVFVAVPTVAVQDLAQDGWTFPALKEITWNETGGQTQGPDQVTYNTDGVAQPQAPSN